METLLIILLYMLFLLLHEIGHILCAKILKLQIDKTGINLIPIPHLYVAVSNIPSIIYRNMFFFSGVTVTAILLVIIWLAGLLQYKIIYISIFTALIVDINPLFSDFTLFDEKYKFSRIWYIHVAGWGGLFAVLYKNYTYSFQ